MTGSFLRQEGCRDFYCVAACSQSSQMWSNAYHNAHQLGAPSVFFDRKLVQWLQISVYEGTPLLTHRSRVVQTCEYFTFRLTSWMNHAAQRHTISCRDYEPVNINFVSRWTLWFCMFCCDKKRLQLQLQLLQFATCLLMCFFRFNIQRQGTKRTPFCGSWTVHQTCFGSRTYFSTREPQFMLFRHDNFHRRMQKTACPDFPQTTPTWADHFNTEVLSSLSFRLFNMAITAIWPLFKEYWWQWVSFPYGVRSK